MTEFAERYRFLVLAPKSRSRTWDAIQTGFGPDVIQVESSLTSIFERVPVDPHRTAIAGFSDGGSYALSCASRRDGGRRHPLREARCMEASSSLA